MPDRHRFIGIFTICLVLCLLPNARAQAEVPAKPSGAHPQIGGLHRKHMLTQSQVGELLLSELRCVACHGERSDMGVQAKAAPNLVGLGNRFHADYIARFIADPSVAQPGTTMPHMLAGVSAERRAVIAKAITQYLFHPTPVELSEPGDTSKKNVPVKVLKGDAKAGRELYHSVGCVACHSPRETKAPNTKAKETLPIGSPTLSHVSSKYSVDGLADFLFQPLATRPAGRMPDMKLTREETRQLTAYLIGEQSTAKPRPVQIANATLIDAGRKYFEQYQCNVCHETSDQKRVTPTIKHWRELDPNAGCASGESHPRGARARPSYKLSMSQTQAIRSALKQPVKAYDTKAQIAMLLSTFNCTSCHVRDDLGGVSPDRRPYFKTSEKDLGEDARIPPPLTLTGAKLRTTWMQKVLFDGETIRGHYMHTRMPQFGEKNIGRLPGLFNEIDKLKPVKLEAPQGRDKKRAYRTAGQQLLGDKGLNCVTCHNFNGIESPGFKGLDLMTSYQRLQPSWFYEFMLSPGKHRPQIVMPTYWPGGKAAQTEILGGDTHAQIEAIWNYLSLGRSAANPPGIRRVATNLIVTDTTRTYRGRSRIAGYRGIAVGFPGGANYAFNAETGTLSGIWKGDFVSVGWSGQGAGNFNPSARAIGLAQDVSLYRLPDTKAPWPLLPKMTKEQPVNPDPLYPRNRGYQFKGYFFDEQSVPTFMYRTGKVSVSDRTFGLVNGDKLTLERTLKFEAPTAEVIWFRVLAGNVKALPDGRFQSDRVTVKVSSGEPLVRPAADGKSKELLIDLAVPKGQSKVVVRYEVQ